ncbi:hypothetical protein H6G00_13365 [Leptolyngbya sp. FACHB-541]|uniref:hypothetical protein n=1 Tax=Leptolyngbya sp. FACHB-541 TaxID=2692810 RepID=UPI001689DA2C|nr:hypothetical protein [Leptolyngbya sp. FACHB-541]MBD1997603.1 hypothetical protein [Leptolyngbya sp. FACHB-541]
MCKICVLAARYPRAPQDSLVLNLSQFASAIAAKPLTEPSQTQSIQLTQEKTS